MSLFQPKEFLKFKIKGARKESIEPDEILLDSEKIRETEEEYESKFEVLIKTRNFKIFLWFILSSALIFSGRLFYFQIVEGNYYLSRAEANQIRVQKIPALRGVIYDKNSVPLVGNEPVIDAILSKKDLPKSAADYGKLLKNISEVLKSGGGSEAEIEAKINEAAANSGDDAGEILIAQNIGSEAYLKFAAAPEKFPGLLIYKNSTRNYLFGEDFSHVIGYVGKASAADLKKCSDCGSADFVGKSGLELVYENELRGRSGRKEFARDSRGAIVGEKEEIPPQEGLNLVLSVDSEFQRAVFELARRHLKNIGVKKGAVAAVNPSNGDVLALASFPGFDANLFTTKSGEADFAELFNNPAKPLFNRAVSGTYPPGSTIKPLIGAAALQEKIVAPSYRVFDEGSIVVPNPYDPEKPSVFKDWKAHGWTDIRQAIAESCNVYFYTVGGGFGDFEGLGVEKIKNYLQKFGFSSPLGIDLPAEAAGFVPSPEWKKENNQYDSVWRIGDTYHLSIGQGDVLATPLQIAAAVSSLANGGILYRPRLVAEIKSAGESGESRKTEIKILNSDFISAENREVILEGMRQTVMAGSARALSDLPFSAAGKTGTAQFGAEGKTHAWFVGFAPYEKPEIAIIVLIEGGGEGSTAAVPLAKEIFRAFFAGGDGGI